MLDRIPSVDRDTNYLTRVVVITLHLACLLARRLQHQSATEEVSKDIHRAIYQLVRLRIRAKSGRTILHLACCRDVGILGRYPSCQFPSPHLAEVLLMSSIKYTQYQTLPLSLFRKDILICLSKRDNQNKSNSRT